MRKLFRRISFLLNRRRLETELAEEMAAHRAMLAEDRRTSFGRDIAIREDARDAWAWVWFDRLWQDLTYALRMFRHAPGFTLGAVTVLALGVGANLAELHVFDALLLHRLSIDGADSIYRFTGSSKGFDAQAFPFAAVEFYRDNSTLCSFVVAENVAPRLIVESESDVRGNFVSGNYFASLRILPAWGRLLDDRDARTGAPAVAVLGYEYWRDKWAADPHVINRMLRMNGQLIQIVGVAPWDFDGLSPHATAVWLPVSQRKSLIAGSQPLESFTQSDEGLYARPKPGASLAAVEAQFTSLTHQLAHREPLYFRPDERIQGDRLIGTGVVTRRLKPAVFLLLFMVLLVLLSACANLGNMLLAQGLARQREIDIRIALGAGRQRVVRQLLTENLLLSAMGSLAGLFVGYMSARFLVRALGAPPDIRIAMDWQIVTASAVMAVFSVLAFGLPPALQLAGAKHKSSRRRQVLVGVQVAVSSLLLICSGVFARSAIRSATIELAFDYQNMIVVDPTFLGQHLPPPVARRKLDEVIARLEQLPGVDALTAAGIPPLGQRSIMDNVPGLPPVYMNYVAPNYFTAMKIPLLRGRAFLPGDQNTVIVSESAARAAWPGEDPLGKTWNIENAQRTIIGLVKDSGANLMVDSESVEAYIPIEAARVDASALILHAKGDPSPLVRAIPLVSAFLREPLTATTMLSGREKMMDTQRKMITVLGTLGVISAVLAAAGMFAMVAFAVAQRTREIGIRMAIGAQAFDVLRALLAQNLAPIAFGMLAGTALGIAIARFVGSAVDIVRPLDPLGFAAGLAVFLLIAALATVSPALKALRIDPSSTLRCE